MTADAPIAVHRHGTSGPLLVALHGGPGAPGSLAAVARELGRDLRVVEPWQRASGGAPLTVARHVADLHAVIQAHCDGRPALVGHSWGAMLALAYAAAHPESAGPLALIGCGTFDPEARARFQLTVHQRLGAAGRAELARLAMDGTLPEERLAAMGRLLDPVYGYRLLPEKKEPVRLDAAGHEETWRDMLRLQAGGTYPAAFAAVTSPVLMLHGDFDPHPGGMIRDGLAPYLARLEYVELAHCGHEPWREAEAREPFFAMLRAWLAAH